MIDGGLRKTFIQHIPEFHWQPIESGLTSRGIFDTNYCYASNEGWIEFKKTKGWSVGMRSEQVAWSERRIRAGGRLFIAVRRCNQTIKSGVVDQLWLFRGNWARKLFDQGLTGTVPDVFTEGGPARWDWERIRAVLSPLEQ